jgi:cytochrome c peroxidase
LSQPAGTSCASCHNPLAGFSGNHGSAIGVPKGSTGALGMRNTPTAMYASLTPIFTVIAGATGAHALGGQFLDGRVDTLAEQALVPLLGTAEMNNPDAATVVAKVQASAYAKSFAAQWGTGIFNNASAAFTAIGVSIQAYESSVELQPFSSRYDQLLRGVNTFNASEQRGMAAFFNPAKGNCASCHSANPSNPSPSASLFTNRSYVALGVPRNQAIPDNADPTFFDLGLAGPKRTAPANLPTAAGSFKVPTLRNSALRTALMHNGYFTSLAEVVTFYATRDLDPQRWYPAGVRFNDLPASERANVTHQPPLDLEPGSPPRLTPQDVSDIVSFLGTLTDVPVITAIGVAQ